MANVEFFISRTGTGKGTLICFLYTAQYIGFSQ
nr:MAG TPA: Dynamin family [Caudoviricetes sp.]